MMHLSPAKCLVDLGAFPPPLFLMQLINKQRKVSGTADHFSALNFKVKDHCDISIPN